jgi:hypothetical protein
MAGRARDDITRGHELGIAPFGGMKRRPTQTKDLDVLNHATATIHRERQSLSYSGYLISLHSSTNDDDNSTLELSLPPLQYNAASTLQSSASHRHVRPKPRLSITASRKLGIAKS